MNTTFFTVTPGARQHHLGDDLGAAELAQQAVAAGHAEDAADRAADLGRDAQAVARQQHAFHRLAVAQFDQQARGAVRAGVLANAARASAASSAARAGRAVAHGQREELLRPDRAAVQRQRPRPRPQHALLVAGLGAEVAQALADVFDAHGNIWLQLLMADRPRRSARRSRLRPRRVKSAASASGKPPAISYQARAVSHEA